jgi:hypothetical protein
MPGGTLTTRKARSPDQRLPSARNLCANPVAVQDPWHGPLAGERAAVGGIPRCANGPRLLQERLRVAG